MQHDVIYFEDMQLEVNERRLCGYAAKFGSLSSDRGGFRVRLMPKCFDAVLASPKLDCVLNTDHDDTQKYARTPDTLSLRADETGLYFQSEPLPNTTKANDLIAEIQHGLYKGMSFAVYPGKTRFVEEGDQIIEEYHTVDRLLDVSVVTRPSFPDTEVNLYRFNEYMEQKKQQEEQEAPRTVSPLTEAEYKQMVAEGK